MYTILAIDDELSIRESYRLILANDYHLLLAEHGRVGLDMLKDHHVDLILLDLTMPSMSGMDVLKELAAQGSTTPVIMVTASNSVSAAVDAIKLGAREYLIKPFDVEGIELNIRRILSEEREKRELASRREADLTGFEALIGSGPAIREVITAAKRACDVDSAVLITGESGTGKDLIARAIHFGGRRAGKAFVPISSCAIPTQLVESELFGHEKGAFTGADKKRIGKIQVADEGTLFLDEMGEMPMEIQAKLLRVLQDHSFYPVGSTKLIHADIRIICATNRDLLQGIQEGTFRQDLYYRINVLHIEMPPLRDRRDDIPELANHFLAKHRPRVNASTRMLSDSAMARLARYPWPGNIRELENSIERLLVHYGQESIIDHQHVAALLPALEDEPVLASGAAAADLYEEMDGVPLEEAVRQVERQLILRALQQSNHVQSRAAELLGTTRRILKYKMDQLDITPQKI